MRSTSVLALFLLCAPLVAGCSGGGQSAASLPSVSNESSNSASAATAPTAALAARPASSATSASSLAGTAVEPEDATSCTHFVTNPECRRLPLHPKVSAYSSAWAAVDFQAGRAYVPAFNAKPGPNPFYDSQDGSDPPLGELKAGAPYISQVINCNAAWGPSVCGTFGIQGKTLHLPVGMEPAGNSDHHYSYNDDAAQKEYDFWLVQGLATTPGGRLEIGAGGACAWSGDGTNCSGSNATNIAGSLGSISEADFQRGELTLHATFGHAISFSALCADPSYVYPASASDGSNTNGSSACAGHTGTNGRPPEGTRVYLNLTDEQINAMHLPPYAAAFWRTLDREHYGGFIADTNWSGAPGLSPAFQRDDFSQQAREAGVNPTPYAPVPIGLGSINMKTEIEFCSNGTC